MKFERGFKAYANRIALEVREDLNLHSTSPLCPWSLADSLSIPVLPLSSFAREGDSELAGHVDYLANRQPKVFSAITVFEGTRRLIVHNDAHATVRQRSNLAHELAHALLIHPPHPPFCVNGQRVFDSQLEAEAGWLGPVLLVTNEGAHWTTNENLPDAEAARHFGVSMDLIRFRLRMSGAIRLRQYRAA
jgi:Zn-dependent peptidase ImmA (M78 family)